MEQEYNKITTVASVVRRKDTELSYKKEGRKEAESLSLTSFFEELDNFFGLLQTDAQIKSIMLNNAIYRGNLSEYASWLRDTLGEYEVTENGFDLDLDEENYLIQHEEEMDNYD